MERIISPFCSLNDWLTSAGYRRPVGVFLTVVSLIAYGGAIPGGGADLSSAAARYVSRKC